MQSIESPSRQTPPDAAAPSATPGAGAPVNPERTPGRFLGWAAPRDHRRLARLNLAIILVVMALGVTMALAQRFTSGSAMSAGAGNGVGAVGLIMAFWVLVPLMPATLGMCLLPQMIGADRFAFPRLNTLCIYLFAVSAIVGVAAIGIGRVDVGWTLDPLSHAPAQAGSAGFWLIVALLVGIVAMILWNLNIVVTTLTRRAVGIRWSQLPAFVWGLNSAALVGVLTLPLGFLALLLLLIDRQWQTGLFDPALGGAPGMYRHAFWFAAYPALFNTLLPAIGIIAFVLGLTPGRAPAAHRRLVWCMVALAALNGMSWGVELMTSVTPVTAAVFSSIAMLAYIPMVIIAVDLLGALWSNGVRLTPPMWYTLAFLFFTGNGLASGLLLRPLSTGMQLFHTPFNTAHLHILLIGGVGSAFFAGLLTWWPRITGRRYSVVWTAVAAVLFFEGVTIAIFPQFVIGLNGVPPHLPGGASAMEQLQRISISGYWLLSLGAIVQLAALAQAILPGARRSGQSHNATPPRPEQPVLSHA